MELDLNSWSDNSRKTIINWSSRIVESIRKIVNFGHQLKTHISYEYT
jgi:hypothetical protein